MIVVDASAYLELVLRTPVGLAVEEAMLSDLAAAPHLLDAEVLHRLVSFERGGFLSAHDVDDALEDLRDAPIARVDHRPLLSRARALAAALSGYDALYVAAAAELGADLLTADRRLARTARRQFAQTVVDLPGP